MSQRHARETQRQKNLREPVSALECDIRTAPSQSGKETLVMLTSKKFIGLALACAGTLAAFTFAQSRASADDGRLAVTPAVYRSADGDGHGATIQLARHGWGGHHGYGYHGGYRGWGGYGYRPYVRP